MNAAWSLALREWVRFYRQRSRVIAAFLTPLLFWLFLGLGLSPSFHPSSESQNINYLLYLIPGNLALIVLFTSIFSTISVIEDRNMGFLQGVLASPASRTSIALGKILGGAFLSFFQAALMLPILIIFLPTTTFMGAFLAAGVLALMSFSLTSLGFFFAWRFNSSQGFHAVMNTILFPMWFLSGALFPVVDSYPAVKFLCYLNPLTYGVNLLQFLLNGVPLIFSASLSVFYLLSFGLVFLILSTRKIKESYAF